MSDAYPGLQFVVEDGSGKVDSTSYVDIAYADTYLTNQGKSEWIGITDTTIKQFALMQATQSIDILYGQEFYSIPRSQGMSQLHPGQAYLQGLLFPRFTMVINQIQVIQTGWIPVQLKNAVCEVALMQINGEDIFPQPNLLKFTKKKAVKAGSVGIDTEYGRDVDAERYPGFWKVDKILYPILKKSNNPTYLSL